MELLKEDGTTPLNNEAAQDYINELEAQVKILIRSKASLVRNLDEYQGETGLTVVMKGLIIDMLAEPDVIDVLKDEILDVLPDLDDLDSRVGELEYKEEQLPDDYEVIDNVVESNDFESKVREIVAVAFNDVSVDVKFNTTNLE
jgi:hypothetical protein